MLTRTGIWLVASALTMAVRPLLASENGGTGTGVSASGVGEQRTRYDFAANGRSKVVTPQHVFVVLPAGYLPLRASESGVVLLRDEQNLYRWSGGQLTRLHEYFEARMRTEGAYRVTETLSWDMNARGTIAINLRQNKVLNLPGQLPFAVRQDCVMTWTSEAAMPVTFSPPRFDIGDPGMAIGSITSAALIGIDDADTLWLDTHLEQSSVWPGGFLIVGLARVDLNGAVTPYLAHTQYQCLGVSRTGLPIGYVQDDETGNIQYYVGPQTVDFAPEYISDNGVVLGRDLADNHQFVWFPDGHTEPVPSDGLVASIDSGDRLLGYDQSGGSPVLWQKKRDGDGNPLSPTQYERIDYVPLTVPSGWETDLLVPPDVVQVTAGTATHLVGGLAETRPFVTNWAQLRVDFNRDGAIETSDAPGAPDREFADKGLPYFFWVNDDDDASETGGDDIPGQPPRAMDAGNDHVDGARDLVDFFPVYLDIERLLGLFPLGGEFSYKLSHRDGALAYVRTELTPATAGKYLRDVATATALANATVTSISAEGTALPEEFLGQILGGGKGVILVEASAPTTAPLALDVWRGAEKIATLELPLSLDGVEKMYRHVNLSTAVGLTPETKSRGSVTNWDDDLSSTKAVVFVHGYNVNEQQARGWQAEIFKRLWWSGSRARFWGVTWHGCESQLGSITPDYHANVVNAFATARQLAFVLMALRSGGATDITVMAHSLGNMVASSAIADYGAPATRLFMLDAAVAAEAYDAAEQQPASATASLPHTDWTRLWPDPYPSEYWASEWYGRFPAEDGRHRLTWRDRFANRAGTEFYNFYSSGEEVLAADDGPTRSIAGVLTNELYRYLFRDEPNGAQAWVYQEKLKGRTISGRVVGSNFGGWGFNNFEFRKLPGTPGNGPVLTPSDMTPAQAAAARVTFTDAVLQTVPFFEPGDDASEVASWVPATDGSGLFVRLREPLGLLYGPDGSIFAQWHRNTLLARMIPAMSLAAGLKAVEKLTPANLPSRSYNMNEMKDDWPLGRQASNATRDRWLHSDLRDVAFPYVHVLFERLVEFGELEVP